MHQLLQHLPMVDDASTMILWCHHYTMPHSPSNHHDRTPIHPHPSNKSISMHSLKPFRVLVFEFLSGWHWCINEDVKMMPLYSMAPPTQATQDHISKPQAIPFLPQVDINVNPQPDNSHTAIPQWTQRQQPWLITPHGATNLQHLPSLPTTIHSTKQLTLMCAHTAHLTDHEWCLTSAKPHEYTIHNQPPIIHSPPDNPNTAPFVTTPPFSLIDFCPSIWHTWQTLQYSGSASS